jgi:hypothetical protein
MLHMFFLPKHVAYVASVSEICCKSLFKMFHLFPDICCNHFYLDVAYVSHICCNSMFLMFQSYVAASGFHVASVLFRCFMCLTHMLQVHVPNISFVFSHMLYSNVFSCCNLLTWQTY